MQYVFKAGASIVKVDDEEIKINFPPNTFKISDLTGISYKLGQIGNGKCTLVSKDKTVIFPFSKKYNQDMVEFFNAIAPIVENQAKESVPEQIKFWDQFNKLPNKDTFGTKKEINYLSRIIQPNEDLKSLTSGLMDGNTWLIACTNLRIIFLDNGILYGLKQMEIPLKSINSINQKQGLLFGEIHIQDGASLRKIENVDKSTIPFFVSQVNEQINALHHPNIQATVSTTTSNLDEIKKLKELLDIDAISQEEFEIKKKELLGL